MAVLDAKARKAQLLDVGAKLAAKHGAINLTRRMVAQAAKVSEPLVSNYFGARSAMQNAMGRQAKKLGLDVPKGDAAKAIGTELRKHKPRVEHGSVAKGVLRKRSPAEVKAIKDKIAGTMEKLLKKQANRVPAKKAPQERKPSENHALPGAPEVKTAARAPITPPMIAM